MPFFQTFVSLSANTSIENVLTGSQYEFAPFNAALSFAVNGSAAGLVADITTGSDVVAENMSVGTQNRTPAMSDDFVAQDVVAAGERVKVRLRNTTSGTLTAWVAVQIMPVRT